MGRDKGVDEMFCRSCGEPIKRKAELCPHCGVPNGGAEEPVARGPTSGGFLDEHGPKFGWAGAVFLLMLALGTLSSIGTAPVAAIAGTGLLVAGSVVALPPVRERVEPLAESHSIPTGRVVVVTVVVALMFAGVMVAPTDDTTSASQGDDGSPSAGSGAATADDAEVDSGSSTGGPSFAIRVVYSGEWSGAASITGGGDSQSETISGQGTRTIDITGAPDIVSVNAQKRDGGAGELTVQILKDGAVVTEASTTSQYGVAQTSKSFF
jgi:hypothetical protein